MGAYVSQQIQNSAKIEATIGIGITTIITTFVVNGAITGDAMPNWAIMVLGMLLATFFGIRIMAYFRFIVEQEAAMRAKKVDAEIEANKVSMQIRLLETQLKKLEAEKEYG